MRPCWRTILGRDGYFYGTSGFAGVFGWGTIFKTDLAGRLTTMHDYNFTEGAFPGQLLAASDGFLYGVTSAGGQYGFGPFFAWTRAVR